MTHTRQYADSEGDFGLWQSSERKCHKLVPQGELPVNQPLTDPRPMVVCGADVLYRAWESSDGSYEDYQYRCENGHVFWIDGIDA